MDPACAAERLNVGSQGRTFTFVKEATGEWLFSGLSSKPLGEFLIHISTVGNGHQSNDSCPLMHGIDNAKAANAILS